MGTWAYSYNFSGLQGLTDLAVKSIESGDKDFTLDKVLASLDTATPGSKWNGSLMKDNNGVEVKKFILRISRYLCIWKRIYGSYFC